MLKKQDVERARRDARETKREVVRPDGGVPGLALRVGREGRAVFALRYRRPGAANPTWGVLAEWSDADDNAKLEAVRKTAMEWRDLLRRGIDPQAREQEEREAAEKAKREADAANVTVQEVYDAYMRQKAAKRRDQGQE
ncbi:MAG TPA: integrase arm-type DNA-binding domain-containing protein, partial [Candidatus Acidoferrum sp.]|nr:integrase arm-type DNA-binding domain-containing protein [Candidatus Acidoferrum sp.]